MVPPSRPTSETAALVAAAGTQLAHPRRAGRAHRAAPDDLALHRHRAAAGAGAGADGALRRAGRQLPAGRDRRQAARPGRRARAAGLRAGRRPVHDRLAQAAGRGAVRAAGAAGRPQGQDRLLDRCPRAGQDPPPAPADRRGRGVARAVEAAEHLPGAAAEPDRSGRRPPAHHLQPDHGRHRPAQLDPPQPPEHPDPHAARPRDPGRLRGRARLSDAVGRLLAGRAADPRPPVRRAGPEGRLRPRRGHPPRDRRAGAGQAGRAS